MLGFCLREEGRDVKGGGKRRVGVRGTRRRGKVRGRHRWARMEGKDETDREGEGGRMPCWGVREVKVVKGCLLWD